MRPKKQSTYYVDRQLIKDIQRFCTDTDTNVSQLIDKLFRKELSRYARKKQKVS